MTDYVTTWPTARTQHSCMMCGWRIMPGERYRRGVALDRSSAWTWKECEHCDRVVGAYYRTYGEDEYDLEIITEWLEDEYPDVYATMRAGWRYPDGERTPPPFQPRCHTCRTLIADGPLWCPPCDEARIARLASQLESLAADLQETR